MKLLASLAAASALVFGGAAEAASVLNFDDLTCQTADCAISQAYGDTADYDVSYRVVAYDFDTGAYVAQPGYAVTLAPSGFGDLLNAVRAANVQGDLLAEITVTAKGNAKLQLLSAAFASSGAITYEVENADGAWVGGGERSTATRRVLDFTGGDYADFGFAVETTSFTLRWSPAADVAVDDVAFSVTGGVPEPASWALMIGGFGLVGSSLRRRKTAVA